MSSTFNDTINYIVDRFKECEEKSYSNLEEIVCDSMIYTSDILDVIEQLGSVNDNTGNETICQYAIGLLYDYILDNGLVEIIDD